MRLSSRLLALLAAIAAVVTLQPPAAQAVSPYQMFEQWVGGSTLAVNGTYTPIVGNFGGGVGDDIFWYAPGPTPDYLWISSTTRGSWTAKVRKDISGTYTPLVGDFAGDRYEDILWYGSGATPDTMWISVDTSAYFSSKSYAINGVYQPLALDMSLPWATAIRDGGFPDFKSAPKDHIIWYRPGSASDLMWQFNGTAGAYDQGTLPIDGSPRLIPMNANGDTFEDFLAYQPGSGADAIFRQDTGAYLKTPKTINGTYNPVPIGWGYFDSVIFHGPGNAADAFWFNSSVHGSPTPASTSAITTMGPIVPFGSGTASAYLYDPNGEDDIFSGGGILDALDPDQGPGAQVVVGDFDHDLGMDAFFYRPGAGAESMAFSATPTFGA
jgi:hypothetical protein